MFGDSEDNERVGVITQEIESFGVITKDTGVVGENAWKTESVGVLTANSGHRGVWCDCSEC